MGDLSKGSGISSIRGGDFELGSNGVSQSSSVRLSIEDITPIALMPLVDDLALVLGTGTATFTRSTIGAFIDKDDGLIKTAAIDAARFEANGVLIEGASTNLALRSEEFDNASWTKAQATVSANSTVAPDGATTADSLLEDSTTNIHSLDQSIAFISGQAYTLSVFVKSGSGDRGIKLQFSPTAFPAGASVSFDPTTGLINTQGAGLDSASALTLVNGYFRFSATATATATVSDTAVILLTQALTSNVASYLGDSTGFNAIWGAQVEQLEFATSYITTTSATVARTADNLSINSDNIPVPTVDYSISATVDVLGFDESASQRVFDVTGEAKRSLIASDNSTPFEPSLRLNNTGTNVQGTALTPNVQTKFVSTRVSGLASLFQDNVLLTGAITADATGTKTSIFIGAQSTGQTLFGHIKDFRIYDIALTADQVKAI